MFKKLDYEATFASTGRTLKASLVFDTGLSAITGPNESGKCLAGTTRLTEARTGVCRTIKEWFDLNPSEMSVFGLNEDGKLVPTPVVALARSGKKPLARLHLKDGSVEDMSFDHPIVTQRGIIPLHKVRPGDSVKCPSHLTTATDADISDNQLVVLAALLSEGCLRNQSLGFTNVDSEIVVPVEGAFKSLGLCLRPQRSRNGQYTVKADTTIDQAALRRQVLEVIDQNGVSLVDWLGSNAYGVRAGLRTLDYDTLHEMSREYGDARFSRLADLMYPQRPLRALLSHIGMFGPLAKDRPFCTELTGVSRRQAALFLQYYFACDGYISKVSSQTELSISSASVETIEFLRVLLLRCGIRCSVRHRKIAGRFDAWEVSPSGRTSRERFCRDIVVPCPLGRKSERGREYLKLLAETKAHSKLDLWPREQVSLELVARGLAPSSLGSEVGPWYLEKFDISRERLAETPLCDLLQQDVCWVKVVEVEDLGREEETFDIQIDSENHLYALNSIITHNSMVLEQCRFGLFGAAALRGKATDYTTLKMQLVFMVRGEMYHITRTLKTATMTRTPAEGASAVIATGTTAVNANVINVLGFALPVFDVACAANQGDIERLSTMRPTERQRMIDSVIGISSLEILAKWAGEEAKLREREADGRLAGLTEPTTPVVPDGYRFSSTIVTEIDALKPKQRRAAELEGLLKQVRTAPVRPRCDVDIPADNIAPLAAQQEEARADIARLKTAIGGIGELKLTPVEEIDALEARRVRFEAFDKAQRELARHPLPKQTEVELVAIVTAWDAIATFDDLSTEVQKAERALAAEKEHALQCPSCAHEWHTDPEAVARYQARLDALVAEHAKNPTRAEQPTISRREAQDLLKVWKTADLSRLADLATVPKEIDPGVTERDIASLRKAHELAEVKARLVAKLTPLEAAQAGKADLTTMLATRRAYEASLETYLVAARAYTQFQNDREDWTKELATLSGVSDQIFALFEQRTVATVYENALQAHTEAARRFEEGKAAAAALLEEADQYRRTQAAFTALRTAVKQHLLPSLNLAASRLLRDMTGGQRTIVFVDEDFDITIDGQGIDTLSGSGKACANLALRLALGQVLTNNVFSVFLGDEIDASMDEFRAENTALTLRTLKNRISQVLLISHKHVEADHVHILGEAHTDRSITGERVAVASPV